MQHNLFKEPDTIIEYLHMRMRHICLDRKKLKILPQKKNLDVRIIIVPDDRLTVSVSLVSVRESLTLVFIQCNF